MKFLNTVAILSGTVSSVAAFAGLPTHHRAGGQFSSSGTTSSSSSSIVSVEHTVTSATSATGYRTSFVRYENDRDGRGFNTDNNHNVWEVLADTEKWISQTLKDSETSSGNNPYSRKEVNYVCETQADSPMITANIFRRLREAREMGEQHGVSEEDHMAEQGESYKPHTLRQTQVMVVPSNKVLAEDFAVFDKFVNAINTARRNARDLVTEKQLDKLDEKMAGETARDWSVSVNCAHLHPKFGIKSTQDVLKEMKDEDESGEVDVNAQEYAKKRMLARQSPYPTIVVEVRSQPPPDWGEHAPPQPPASQAQQDNNNNDDGDDEDTSDSASPGYTYNRKELLAKEVTSEDVQNLEALFGKPAATNHPVSGDAKPTEKAERENTEEEFYDSIGKAFGIEEVSGISPLKMAHSWVYENDDKFSSVTSAFTESDTAEVDQAYEFVFTNIAMQQESVRIDNIHGSRRQYLVMPHFLTSSATSLEKFTKEVTNIVNTLPDLRDKVQISTFHPEHIEDIRRSPLPIICLQWTEGNFSS